MNCLLQIPHFRSLCLRDMWSLRESWLVLAILQIGQVLSALRCDNNLTVVSLSFPFRVFGFFGDVACIEFDGYNFSRSFDNGRLSSSSSVFTLSDVTSGGGFWLFAMSFNSLKKKYFEA